MHQAGKREAGPAHTCWHTRENSLHLMDVLYENYPCVEGTPCQLVYRVQVPGDTVLVAGATGGVGQILTAKLLEVSVPLTLKTCTACLLVQQSDVQGMQWERPDLSCLADAEGL